MTPIAFWIAVGVLSLGVALAVAAPMLRAGERIGRARRASYDLAVFRDQLAEVDRDRETGRLDATEAAAAKAEIERRMLRAVDDRAEAEFASGEATAERAGAAFPIAVGLVVAGASVALYVNIGEPGSRDWPLAQRTDIAEATAAGPGSGGGVSGPQMIASLRDRLTANPEDVNGWVTLARTHAAINEHREAARAFEKAIELMGQRAPAEMISDYGEALVFEAFGTVSPRAVETFRQSLAKNPSDIKSRFYIGMAREQSGDYRGAIALWRGLTADAPAGAPWAEAVRERMSQAAMQAGIMPMSVEPERFGPASVAGRPAPGSAGVSGAIAGEARPTDEDVQAVQDMSAEDRQAFIRSMVERLADKMQEKPDDIDGWIRLGRAYKVLGENEKATDALGEARSRLENLLAKAPDGSPTRASVEETLNEVKALMVE